MFTDKPQKNRTTESGAGAVEYAGIIIVVVVLVGALLATPSINAIADSITCRISQAIATLSGAQGVECDQAGGSQDSSTTPEAAANGITVTQNPTSHTSTAQVTINLPPGVEWRATSDSDWAVPNGNAGVGSGVLDVTFRANPGDNRTATITVTGSNGQVYQVKVGQAGGTQTYLALGDSYSAGPGVAYKSGYDESEPPHKKNWLGDMADCNRGRDAWPRRLGNGYETRSGTPNLAMSTDAFLACTGATVDGSGNSPSVLSQIENNADELRNADIVTLTVGGNDIGFADIVKACVIPFVFGDCLAAVAKGNRRIDEELPQKLTDTYLAMLENAENATIYVVGYPPVVEEDDRGGGLLSVGKVAQANIEETARLIQHLNDVTAGTISQLLKDHPEYAGRLVFVDPGAPGSPFIGHSVNDPDPYMLGLEFVWGQADIFVPHSYHPNIAGNEAYAEWVGQYILGRR